MILRGVFCVCSACVLRVVCVWSACGLRVVCVWSACGLRVVCVWSACGLRVVCVWSACGLRVVCVWSACVLRTLWYDIILVRWSMIVEWVVRGRDSIRIPTISCLSLSDQLILQNKRK